MDKDNQMDSDCVGDEDVFEDALEETIDENTEPIDVKTTTKSNNSESTGDSTIKSTKNTNEVLTVKNDNKTNTLNNSSKPCIENSIKTNLNNSSTKTTDSKIISSTTNKSIDKADNQKNTTENEINNNELATLKEKLATFKVCSIEDGFDKCIQSAFKLNEEFFRDQFEFVIQFCEANYKKNIFYSLIYGGMYFIKTWMIFEQQEIQKCLEVLTICSDHVNSKRKVYSWSDYIRKINYDTAFTDEEAHAEIIYAELQILLGATTFIKDQNFSSLFKGALKFKAGYQSFKFCRDIYLNRKKWSSDIAKNEFKSNLLASSGVFHLSIAYAPPRVTQVLEFVGFNINKEYALEQLRKSMRQEKTVKSNYALIALLVHYSYTQVTIGWGDYELDELTKLVQIIKKKNPTSVFTNYFAAKELQLTGELDKSVAAFKQITETTKDYIKQINNACYWELLSLYASKGQWLECAQIAHTLRSCSLWSPCVFTFIYGISLYMLKEETGNLKLQDEIDECFREVPRLRRRLAGKSTPIEKLAMSKCAYYFAHDRKLVLPMHELMFYYNLTCTFMNDKTIMSSNLQIIENKIKEYDVSKLSKLGQTNDYCLLLTLKGSYLRLMKFPSLAIETLEKIFLFSKDIEENHLIPFATQELAFCYLQLEQYDYAKRFFKSCINHSKYTAELILHFRTYNALRTCKSKMKQITEQINTKLDESEVQNNSSNSTNKVAVDLKA